MRSYRTAIALGSNLGDRWAHLEYAVARLGELLAGMKVSSFSETDPVGVGEQPKFLNAAVVGETTLSTRALFEALGRIEAARGRERPFPGAPRTLDLDFILYGDSVIDEPDLVVPHPRFRDRPFVLRPLAEIAPDLVDPITKLTVGDLLTKLRR